MKSELRITAMRLLAEKKKPGREGRFQVELEGEPWAALEAETVVTHGLKKGLGLDAGRRREILLADETLRAGRAAARRSALKLRPRAELERFLKSKGFGGAAIGRALDALAESGTVDDDAVARRWVRKRRREGGTGPRRIRAELVQQGVARAAIERALEAMRAESDPAATCRALARKQLDRFRPISEPKNRNRLRAFLARRGFDEEAIETALDGLGEAD